MVVFRTEYVPDDAAVQKSEPPLITQLLILIVPPLNNGDAVLNEHPDTDSTPVQPSPVLTPLPPLKLQLET